MTERVRFASRHREYGKAHGLMRVLKPEHESKTENHSRAARASHMPAPAGFQPLPWRRMKGTPMPLGPFAFPSKTEMHSMQVVMKARSSVPDTDGAFFNLRHFFRLRGEMSHDGAGACSLRQMNRRDRSLPVLAESDFPRFSIS